jgi:hypothetical protein
MTGQMSNLGNTAFHLCCPEIKERRFAHKTPYEDIMSLGHLEIDHQTSSYSTNQQHLLFENTGVNRYKYQRFHHSPEITIYIYSKDMK